MQSATLLPVLEIKRRGDPTEGSNPSFSAIYLAKSLNHNDLAMIDQTNYQIHYQQNQLSLAHAKRQNEWSVVNSSVLPQAPTSQP
jgi:hypothetical protein